jgi:hypothetical protein
MLAAWLSMVRNDLRLELPFSGVLNSRVPLHQFERRCRASEVSYAPRRFSGAASRTQIKPNHSGSLWPSESFVVSLRLAIAFLEDARARHLLRRIGGSYQFVHRLLLDYFADLDGTAPPMPNSTKSTASASTSPGKQER